jgi:hypothetical protein
VVSPTGMKSRALIGQNPAGKDRPAAVRPPPRCHRKKSFNIGPACRSRAKQMSSRYPQQELHLRMPSWYNPAMVETKTSHQTLAAARMRRMRQRSRRGAFLVTLELEPDDLAALRVPSPDLAGQAIFRLIDRLKAAR